MATTGFDVGEVTLSTIRLWFEPQTVLWSALSFDLQQVTERSNIILFHLFSAGGVEAGN